jgi:peptidyl-prolyl cis-trans isomerase-like protein 2
MFLTASEWKELGGFKGAGSGGNDFQRLELDCCALSFLPFEHPVCSPQGHIFELERIVPFLQTHHRNPVTNEPLEVKQLIKLHFARNEEGDLMCPTLFKPFSEHTHVVALRTTGNVFSYEALETLCLKTKPPQMRDLLDDSPFTRADIIELQNPHNILARNPANFAHIRDEQMAKLVDGMKSAAASAAASAARSSASGAAAPAASGARKPRPALDLGISLAPKVDGSAAAAAASLGGPARGLYSSGAVSGSFTSTSMSVSTQNERQVLSAEEVLAQRYEHLRKKGAKGYVRLHTTLGNINLEVHADLVPRTAHNFMELCERGYYKDTRFHRVIPSFMLQGGDPDGTGRGGEGAFAPQFADEFHSKLRHDARGVLSMANSGPNTNASQFFLTFGPAQHLDNKHSVFGRLVGGGEVLDALEKVETIKTKTDPRGPKDCPVKEVRITAITVYTNPFKEDFTPVDALTRKKEGEAAEAEAKAAAEAEQQAGEMGKWFSNPQAAATSAAGGDANFKYLNLPKPQQKGSDNALSAKRKGSPNAAEDAGALPAHPALRAAAAAAAAAGSPMDTNQTPKAPASSEEDEAARAFEAAKRRQQQAKQQAAAAAAAAAAQAKPQASYGNFGNF